jgi:hypothetical protein
VKGLAIAKGYVNFFEPDVFVESEEGLLEEAGLGALREKHIMHPYVVTLRKFLVPERDRDWSDPAFGLNIMDVFRYIYESERRFQLKNDRPSVLVKRQQGSGLVEAVFGFYPQQRDTDYIAKGYKDVFAPAELKASPAAWLEVFKNGAETPLNVTRHGLELQRYWYHDLLIYVFDPTRPTDLIDLWNLRIMHHPVLPVPIDWFENLADHIRGILKEQYRPIRGNPQGVMHHSTIEFGRSIGKDKADRLLKVLLQKDLPTDAFHANHWRNPIWITDTDDQVHRERRLQITADEQRTSLEINERQELTAKFETLSPKFAARFGGHNHRWVNAVSISKVDADKIAAVFPFNIFDRAWPRLAMAGDRVIVGTEGWIFSQQHRNWSQYITPLTMEDAVIGSLKVLGIQAELSDPGHIAKQMLDQLGGVWGTHLLADLETLQLLNIMAGGVRRRNDATGTIEETFERRSAPMKEWIGLMSRRKKRQSLPALTLSEFTKKNLIKLGLETVCPHCQVTNWHSLTAVDYGVTCERCLNRYDFPQAELSMHNRNWHYRVVGPFSVPDYGRGAYSAVLSLRVIKSLHSSFDEMTFSTAMNLTFDGIAAEADFVVWRRAESLGTHYPPELIIGETKSLGKGDLIKPKDLAKLKAIGQKLPGAILVISVLRDSFTTSEKKWLQQFVKWCRRLDKHGRQTNPVILLTANELFFEHGISETWEKLGELFKSFAGHEHSQDLHSFAEATQSIYLGLPLFDEWYEAEWKKRLARKK